jgi:hypothetical protein
MVARLIQHSVVAKMQSESSEASQVVVNNPFMSDCFMATEGFAEGHCHFPVAEVRIKAPCWWRSSTDLERANDWVWSPAAFRLLLSRHA